MIEWVGIVEAYEPMGIFYSLIRTEAHSSAEAKNIMAKNIKYPDFLLCCFPNDAAAAIGEGLLTKAGRSVEGN